MYYQNGNYMQDLNYYNQNPNMNWNYSNPNMNMNGAMPNQMMPQANLASMYPAIYRIIMPVVSRVVSNNNMNYVTEESLCNMVDTVYNIVEGDINLNTNERNNLAEENNSQNQQSAAERSSSSQRQGTSAGSTRGANVQQNTLLRDLIRILILNEITDRRRRMNQQMIFQNANMNGNMYL